MSETKDSTERYDALAYNMSSRLVTLIYGRDMNLADARATVDFAVIRRGVEEEVHVVTRAGMYAEGDKYDGNGLPDGLPEAAS